MGECPPKDAWGPGPWNDEPDEAYWQHLGYNCMAMRASFGAWCGYVAVPAGHPFWGAHYGECFFKCEPRVIEIPEGDERFNEIMRQWYERRGPDARLYWECQHRIDNLLSVHGGITFAGEGDPIYRHHPNGNADDWYIGFDCNHAWDYAPGMRALMWNIDLMQPPGLPGMLDDESRFKHETYRTLDYVKAETNALAEQIAGYGLPLYRAQNQAHDQAGEAAKRRGAAPHKRTEGE